MRTDVKLGVVIALATVLVAGGYYMDGDSAEKPVEMTKKSLADAAKPSAGKSPGGRNAAAPATSKAAAKQSKASRQQGKASPGTSRRGAAAHRKPGAKPAAATPRKSANARAAHQNKKRMGQTGASKTPKPKPAMLKQAAKSTASPPVQSTKSGATSTDRTQTRASVPPPASNLRKTVPAAASKTARRPGTTAARQVKATKPVGRTSGTPVGSTPAEAAKRRALSGQSPRGVRRPNSRGATQRNALAKKGRNPAARRNPTTPAKKMDPRSVAVDVHRVQPGDSLAALAKMYYGHEKHVPFLVKSNPKIGDPRRLALGTVVRIPPLPTTEPANEPTSTRVSKVSTRHDTNARGPGRSYTVKAGDSFYGIARSQLGDAGRWRALYELNARIVGDDPSRLKIGQVIKLPPK